MANIYIDCEYNSFKGALISMALVADSGEEFYEVLPCEYPHPWVAANVMPILNKQHTNVENFTMLLQEFLSRFKTVHVIADWPEDIALFCNALIISAGQRINTPPLTMEVRRDDCPSKLPHNALEDARGLKDYYNG